MSKNLTVKRLLTFRPYSFEVLGSFRQVELCNATATVTPSTVRDAADALTIGGVRINVGNLDVAPSSSKCKPKKSWTRPRKMHGP